MFVTCTCIGFKVAILILEVKWEESNVVLFCGLSRGWGIKRCKIQLLEGARGAEPGLQTGFPRGNENSSTRFPIPEATQSDLEALRVFDFNIDNSTSELDSHVHIPAQLVTSVPATPNPLPAPYHLSRSAQEHAGRVYRDPIANFPNHLPALH